MDREFSQMFGRWLVSDDQVGSILRFTDDSFWQRESVAGQGRVSFCGLSSATLTHLESKENEPGVAR